MSPKKKAKPELAPMPPEIVIAVATALAVAMAKAGVLAGKVNIWKAQAKALAPNPKSKERSFAE